MNKSNQNYFNKTDLDTRLIKVGKLDEPVMFGREFQILESRQRIVNCLNQYDRHAADKYLLFQCHNYVLDFRLRTNRETSKALPRYDSKNPGLMVKTKAKRKLNFQRDVFAS